jgi:hypothetical protein
LKKLKVIRGDKEVPAMIQSVEKRGKEGWMKRGGSLILLPMRKEEDIKKEDLHHLLPPPPHHLHSSQKNHRT